MIPEPSDLKHPTDKCHRQKDGCNCAIKQMDRIPDPVIAHDLASVGPDTVRE